MKYGLQFWQYILNINYFLDCFFSDLFLEKLYRTRPVLNYASANDFLTLSILLAQQKWERGPVLSFSEEADWASTGTDYSHIL